MLQRITLVGAVFLGVVAILPWLVQLIPGLERTGGQTQSLLITSTGLLIVVGVVLDTMKQLEAQLVDAPLRRIYQVAVGTQKYIVLDRRRLAPAKGPRQPDCVRRLSCPTSPAGTCFARISKNQTELGLKANAYMERGELVPDDVTIAMVMDRLARPDCANGALARRLSAHDRSGRGAGPGAWPPRAGRSASCLSIAVPDEALVERLSGRWLCRTCGEAYHTLFNPPRRAGVCDKDGGELYQRDDDKPETVRNRLKVYWAQTSPLIDYYRRRGVLVEVDGNQPLTG